MKTVTIYESARYRVDSQSNGGAYTVTRLSDGANVFIRYGDDAANFRAELDIARGIKWPGAVNSFLADYDELMELRP